MQRDYYEVLGVAKGANGDDIRRAYRKMARDHHPDLNQHDGTAEQRFKEINEAYEVLRDPQKRTAYDRFGHAGVRGAAASQGYGDFGDLGDIFETVFGFGARAGGRTRSGSRAARGDDRRAQVSLEFEEAVFGVTRTLRVDRLEACEACSGSGAAPGSSPVTCTVCGGSGEMRRVQQSVFGAFVNVQPCADCKGRGETAGEKCPDCAGGRRVRKQHSLDVDIPAGVEHGTQIRLSGEGDHGLYGGGPGDLYVALDVADHPIFERHGNDLQVEMWLNPADAALGAEVMVPTLSGETRVTVPPGTQSGDTLRLEGIGVPYLRGRGRGDQVVTVHVKTPEKLTSQQRELLEQLRGTLPGAHVGRRNGGFWDKVKQKFA
jgi:molecular chaperone DnaJ